MRQGSRRPTAALGCGGALLGIALLVGAGCDVRPGPPRTRWWRRVEAVAVDTSDRVETDAVRKLLDARERYEQALKVLQTYYVRTGAFDKQQWTEEELENLREAQTWHYVGASASDLPGRSMEGTTQAALVEAVLAARRDWKDALKRLADYYAEQGMGFKLAMVRNVQQRFLPEHQYDYYLEAEVPPPTLKPSDVIPAADDLFERALAMHEKGKPLPLITSYSKQREALLMFRELVEKYPTSTKVARAAYYIGEIYKEYFDEDIRAVTWYQRAWEWDPNIMLPARSQAAFVYDIRLGEYDKALELYREVIKHEQYHPDRVRYAYQRIEELMARKRKGT